MDTPLNLLEARVLACLIEKATTTPEYYPLTLNALTAACNQKSNRDPAMHLTDDDVLGTIESLRQRKLIWVVTQAGSRVPKYQHRIPEVMPLTPPQLAVLAELMLRGPQTVSELRTRASRMAELPDQPAVQAVLQALLTWASGPLVMTVPRQPGQREERYAHLWCGEEAARASMAPVAPGGAADATGPTLAARVAKLEEEVAQLKEQLASLLPPSA